MARQSMCSDFLGASWPWGLWLLGGCLGALLGGSLGASVVRTKGASCVLTSYGLLRALWMILVASWIYLGGSSNALWGFMGALVGLLYLGCKVRSWIPISRTNL